MIRFQGGQEAGRGKYWNIRTGERIRSEGAAVLPGGPQEVFLRLPAAAVLLLGPLLGLAFAVFLPFIAIAVTAVAGTRKIGSILMAATGRGLSFGWRPGESFLAGARRVKKRRQETSPKDSVPR